MAFSIIFYLISEMVVSNSHLYCNLFNSVLGMYHLSSFSATKMVWYLEELQESWANHCLYDKLLETFLFVGITLMVTVRSWANMVRLTYLVHLWFAEQPLGVDVLQRLIIYLFHPILETEPFFDELLRGHTQENAQNCISITQCQTKTVYQSHNCQNRNDFTTICCFQTRW